MRRTNGIGADTKAEAAAWLARLHADDRSEADENAFHAWMAAKPENARAFEAVTALWDLADGLRAERPAPSRPRFLLRRRTILAGIGSLAAASAGFGVWEEAFAGVYETDVGEQKHVTLSDGTQVFLDTDTRIRERFNRSLRTVELDRGRADFRTKSDTRRAFVAEAAGQHVIADQAIFDVRRDGNRITIVLLEGRATVRVGAGAQQRSLMLAQGQRLVVANGIPILIDKPDLSPLTAWQTGLAIFESEALAVAAAEMNRYSTVVLQVDDPVIANLRLSGVYRVGDNEAFARSVSRLLPVAIEHFPDHIELIRDTSRMPQG